MPSELELKQLRLQAFDMLQAAKASGNAELIASAKHLLTQIDVALDAFVIGEYEDLAGQLADLADALTNEPVAGPTTGSSSAAVGAVLPNEPPAAGMDTHNPPPPGPASTFVSARKIADKTILYIDDAGREFVREGGSRAWRNCNPGNIRHGDFAKLAGSIGDDGAFAVFPSEAVGKDAIASLLKTNAYKNLTVKDAVFRYAPPSENNSAAYAANIQAATGIALTTIMHTLSAAELRKVANAIQKIEGWSPGTERAYGPLSGTSASGGISSSAGAAASDWMTVARSQEALPAEERSQWSDPGENPRILNYFKVAAPWFEATEGDEVDWCAAFVNYCLLTSGYGGTNHPGARSFFWNKNNHFVSLPGPAVGAVAVRRYAPFDDASWQSGQGHVGFIVSHSATEVRLLGGNQGGTVKEQTYPRKVTNSAGKVTAEFIAFMMPVIS